MCNASVQAKRRNCGRSAVSSTSALENCRTCTTHDDHLVNVQQLENLCGRPRESAFAPRQGCRRTPRLYDHRDDHSLDELHEEVINYLVKVLQLRNFHSLQHEEHDMHNDAHVNNLVQELDAEATSGSESAFTKKLREKPKPM